MKLTATQKGTDIVNRKFWGGVDRWNFNLVYRSHFNHFSD